MHTQTDAQALATLIAKQSSNVSIKVGRTNGSWCLHLRNRAARQSRTLYEAIEWMDHDWNFTARRGV